LPSRIAAVRQRRSRTFRAALPLAVAPSADGDPPRWSPDGTRIALVGDRELTIVDLETGTSATIADGSRFGTLHGLRIASGSCTPAASAWFRGFAALSWAGGAVRDVGIGRGDGGLRGNDARWTSDGRRLVCDTYQPEGVGRAVDRFRLRRGYRVSTIASW
jgi:hypothetical protein